MQAALMNIEYQLNIYTARSGKGLLVNTLAMHSGEWSSLVTGCCCCHGQPQGTLPGGARWARSVRCSRRSSQPRSGCLRRRRLSRRGSRSSLRQACLGGSLWGACPLRAGRVATEVNVRAVRPPQGAGEPLLAGATRRLAAHRCQQRARPFSPGQGQDPVHLTVAPILSARQVFG